MWEYVKGDCVSRSPTTDPGSRAGLRAAWPDDFEGGDAKCWIRGGLGRHRGLLAACADKYARLAHLLAASCAGGVWIRRQHAGDVEHLILMLFLKDLKQLFLTRQAIHDRGLAAADGIHLLTV